MIDRNIDYRLPISQYITQKEVLNLNHTNIVHTQTRIGWESPWHSVTQQFQLVRAQLNRAWISFFFYFIIFLFSFPLLFLPREIGITHRIAPFSTPRRKQTLETKHPLSASKRNRISINSPSTLSAGSSTVRIAFIAVLRDYRHQQRDA